MWSQHHVDDIDGFNCQRELEPGPLESHLQQILFVAPFSE